MTRVSPARVGIVGYGRFGRALAELASHRGASVHAFDPHASVPEDRAVASLDALVDAPLDVLVVATPIEAMPGVFDAIAARLRARLDASSEASAPLVLDVGSVKVAPSRALEAAFGVDPRLRAVPTHPLFGPMSLARAERPLTTIVCPAVAGGDDATRAAADFYVSLGCETVFVTPEEHDEIMARTHALAFFFAKGIVDAGLDAPAPFAPPSFQAMARSVDAVRADAGHLFRSIEVENPFAASMRRALLSALTASDAELARAASAAPPESGATARSPSVPALAGPPRELAEARQLIDELDRDLVRLLARRAELATRAARAKGALGIATRDERRETELLTARREWAESQGLDPSAVADVFEAILAFSRGHQTRVR